MKLLILLSLLTFQVFALEVSPHVIRLEPGADPKVELTKYVQKHNIKAASIVSAVGSLKKSVMRYANQKDYVKLEGFREVLSLSGTIGSTSGSHIHMSVADSEGKTLGGHLGEGSEVYTTLEIVLLAYPTHEFERKLDPKTTFQELFIKKK